MTALAACSSDSSSSDATTAELDARVTSLEEQVRGLESIIGRVIIADPAGQMQQLEAEVSALAKDLADAEASAAEAADAVSEQVATAQTALADAQAAAASAKDAVGEAQAQAIIDAQARVADARGAIDELKAAIAAAVGSPAATPAPSAS